MADDHGGICAELRKLTDRLSAGENVIDEILRHSSAVCSDCIVLKVNQRRKGQEWLYPDGPPPWIVEQNEREAEANRLAAIAQKLEARPKKEMTGGRGIPEGMTPHEYIEKLVRDKEMPLGVLTNEARIRLGLEKHQALLVVKDLMTKIHGSKREHAKTSQGNETGGTDVSPQKTKKWDMPWAPPLAEVFCPEQLSMMQSLQQKRYIATLTNLQGEKSAFIHKDNANELKAWDKELSAEREMFQQEVLTLGQKAQASYQDLTFWCLAAARDFVLSRWMNRLDDLTRRYTGSSYFLTKPVFELAWPPDAPMGFDNNSKPLMEAVVAKSCRRSHLKIPSMKTRQEVQFKCEDLTARFGSNGQEEPSLRPPIFDAKDLESHLSPNGTTIVMEASAVLALCVDEWSAYPGEWAIPVQVSDKFGKEGVQRSCVVGKPIPTGNATKPMVVRAFYKWMVRAKYVRYIENSNLAPSTRRFLKKKQERMQKSEAPPAPPQATPAEPGPSETPSATVHDDDDTGGALQICVEEEEVEEIAMEEAQEPPVIKAETSMGTSANNSQGPKHSTSVGDFDFLECLLDQAAKVQGVQAAVSESQYARVRFGQGAMPILVRSGGGNEEHGADKSITYDVKIEYFPQCGAMALSDEEWLFHYFKHLITGSQRHVLFRIHPSQYTIVGLEHLFPISHGYVADERQALVAARSTRMKGLIDELHSLSEGNYVLTKKNGQLSLYMNSGPDVKETFDLNGLVPKIHFDFHHQSHLSEIYTSIDPHRYLQWQLVMGRAPCTFLPPDHPSTKKLQSHAKRMKYDKKARPAVSQGAVVKDEAESSDGEIKDDEEWNPSRKYPAAARGRGRGGRRGRGRSRGRGRGAGRGQN